MLAIVVVFIDILTVLLLDGDIYIFNKKYIFADELPSVDLLASRSLSGMFDVRPVSDDDSTDIEIYKVVSLPVIIERYVTAPIRAQLVSFYTVFNVLDFHSCFHALVRSCVAKR